MQRVREQVQVPEQLHSGAGRVKSVTVAVLDTGIAYHPDLVGRLLAFSDFVEGVPFRMTIMDTGHMSAGLYAEAENCPEEDFAEWHRRQSLWWEKCWTDRGRAPVIPCRKLWNGYCG